MYQEIQILKKLKLFIKLKINKMNIYYNIMIFDIDKNNNNFKVMNILQLKWILHIQIQKKNYLKIFNKIIKLFIKIFINN